MAECSVRVVCRFRPVNKRETEQKTHGSFLKFDASGGAVTVEGDARVNEFGTSEVLSKSEEAQ